MDTSLPYDTPLNEQEIANVFTRVFAESLKSVPKPEMPAWMQALGELIKAHPWVFSGIVVLILLVCFFIVRELICSYFKTNEILERLKSIEKRI
ncbi:MAG: hypothetical protein ABIC68_05575 [Candidatus Omnitrophota bacterium]